MLKRRLLNLRKLWLSLLLMVGATAIAVPGIQEIAGTEEETVVEIGTVDQLKAFRDAVNSGNQYAGKTVKLTADLDLSGEANWKPIGNLVAYPGQSFNGIFDGDGHTISNLTVNDNTPNYAVAALFGSVVNGTIKNLTVKDVNITSTHYAAGIVAYTSNGPTIENCHVIGGTIKSTPEIVNGSYDNGDKVGGIMGYATAGSTIKNCTVEGVTLSAYRDMGGIVGYSDGTVTNNTAKNVTVTQDLTNGYKDTPPTTIGDIVGRGSSTNNVEANGNKVIKSDPVAQIGETKYETIAEAVAAANASDVIEIIKAGEYTLPNLPKNVTIEGAVDGVVFNHTTTGSVASIPDGATFKNVTFNFGNNNYHGFQHAGTINMEGCTLNGKLFSYGDMNFTNCEFKQTNSDYNMWVYGAGNVVYDQCTFSNTVTGKLLHLYCESADQAHKVTVKDCKFVNEGSQSKAAINVKATSGSNALQYELHLEGNNTYEGSFPTAVGEQDNSDHTWILSPLAQVDDRSVSPDHIKVYENDVLIYPEAIAKIADVIYPSLQSALDAAHEMTGDVTVELLKDIEGFSIVRQKAGLNLTIDGSEKTVNGQIIIDGDGRASGTETLTIKNIKFEDDASNFCAGTDAFVLVPSTKDANKPYTTGKYNYAHNITITDCSFNSTADAFKLVGFKSTSGATCYNLSMSNVTGNNLHSFAQLTATNGAAFDKCSATMTGSFIGVNGGSGAYTISNCEFESHPDKTDGYAYREKSNSTATATLTNNNFKAYDAIILGSAGTINVESGTYIGQISKTAGNIVISDGHFSAKLGDAVYAAFIAEGKAGVNGLYPDDENAPNGIGTAIAKLTDSEGKVSNYATLEAAFASATDGETITLLQNITLTENLTWNTEGEATFTLNLGEFKITKGDYSVALNPGETIKTDKRTDIFSALEEGYKVIETTVENGYSYTVEDDVSDIQTSYYPVTADYKIQNKGTHRFVDVKGTYYAKPDVAFVEDADYIHVGVGVQNLDANGVADGTWKTYSLSAENPAPRAGDPTTIEVFSYVGKAIKLATQLAVDHIGRLVDAHAGSSGIITDSNKESIKTALDEIAQAAIELYANDYGYLTLVPQDDNSVMVKATIPVIPESVDAACQKITGKSAWEWAKSEVVEYINTKNPDETLSAYVLNNLDNVSPGNTYYLTAESNRSFGYVLESQVASVGDNAYWILADQKNVETPKIADGEYQIQNVDTKYFVNVYGQYQAEPNIEAIDILTDQTLEANSMITLKSGRYDYSDDNLFQIYELANGSQNVAAYLAKAVNVVKALADAKFTEKQDQIDKVLNMLKDYGVEITDEQLKSDVNLAIDLYAGRYGNVKLQDNGDETVSLFVDVPAIPAEEMVNTAYEKLAGGYDNAWEWAKAQVVNYFSDGHSPNISADFVSRNLAKVNPGKTYYLSAKADKTFDFVEHAAQDYSVTEAEKWLLTKVTPETTDIDLYDNVTDFPDDYKTYWFTEDTQVKSVTYHRKFKGSHVPKYQSWFVPFDYTTTGEEGGDFYSLHFVAASGSQTGVVEDAGAVYIYIRKMTTGATLKANKPYVFVPAAAIEDHKFVAENVTMTAPKTDTRFHVESAEYNYDFYGTYDDAYPAREAGKDKHYFLALGGGKISWNSSANGHLTPYRWYVVPTARDAYSDAKLLMFVEDVPEATDVNNAVLNSTLEIEGIYSPNGVKLDEPAQGVNIVKYTNGTTKKIILK